MFFFTFIIIIQIVTHLIAAFFNCVLVIDCIEDSVIIIVVRCIIVEVKVGVGVGDGIIRGISIQLWYGCWGRGEVIYIISCLHGITRVLQLPQVLWYPQVSGNHRSPWHQVVLDSQVLCH